MRDTRHKNQRQPVGTAAKLQRLSRDVKACKYGDENVCYIIRFEGFSFLINFGAQNKHAHKKAKRFIVFTDI